MYESRAPALSCLCLSAICVLFAAGPAAAADPINPWQIFSKGNVEYLCPNWIEPRTVDRDLLAKAIVDAARVPPHVLRRANADGQPVPLPIPASHYVHYVASSEPFGPNTATYSDELKAALDAQRLVRASVQQWFSSPPEDRGKVFKLKGPPGTIYVDDFFAEKSQVTIECKADRPGGGQQKPKDEETKPAPPDVFGEIKSSVVVRKGVADIGVEKSKLKKANAAVFSLTEETAFRSYSIEGLVGVTIIGNAADRAERLAYASAYGYQAAAGLPYYWFKLTPYVYHKRYEREPDSKNNKDTDQIQPGLAGTITYVSPTGFFAFDAIVDVSQNSDSIQNSSFYNAGIIFSPSFQFGNTTIFGAPLFFGPVGIRPNLSLIARQFYIDEKGTNAELAAKSSFTSLGYRSEVKIFSLADVFLLSNLEGRVAFASYDNGGVVRNVNRFEGGISFSPSGSENVTLELQYIRGRDERTLIFEERWTAGVGFRY